MRTEEKEFDRTRSMRLLFRVRQLQSLVDDRITQYHQQRAAEAPKQAEIEGLFPNPVTPPNQ